MGREQGHVRLCVEPGGPQSPMDTVIRPDPRRLGPGGRRGRDAAERPPMGGVLSSGDEAGQAVCIWKLRARCPRGMKLRGSGGVCAVEGTELWTLVSRIWMVQSKCVAFSLSKSFAVCFSLRTQSRRSCPTLCDPMGRRPPGSSIHGIS